MKNFSRLFSLLLFFSAKIIFADATSDIARIDQIRFPQEDYTSNITITQIKPEKDNRIFKYELLVKGREMALLKTLEPLNEKGKVVLMRGLDTWIYLPTISQPVRLSLRERLLGDVSVGDIARANFSGDYMSEFLKEENLNDVMFKVYELKAVNEQIPYSRVLLWARSSNLQPYQAHFFGNSGKLLKTATYDKFKEVSGEIRPTRIVMGDPLKKGQYTVVDYDQIVIKPMPEQYFTSSYINRLSD